jgi:hypothetical protein
LLNEVLLPAVRSQMDKKNDTFDGYSKLTGVQYWTR